VTQHALAHKHLQGWVAAAAYQQQLLPA
jgi:hypothetical protein